MERGVSLARGAVAAALRVTEAVAAPSTLSAVLTRYAPVSQVQVRPGELERASVVHDEDRLSRALRVLQEESRAAPYHPDIYAPIGNAARSGGRGGRGSHAPRHVGGDWAPAYPGADRAAYGSPSIPVWSAGAHNGHPDALPAVPGVDGGRQGSPGRQAPVYVTYDTLPERKKRVTDELLRRALQPASPSRPGVRTATRRYYCLLRKCFAMYKAAIPWRRAR